jgi:2-keto-4-pentenoate hydratase
MKTKNMWSTTEVAKALRKAHSEKIAIRPVRIYFKEGDLASAYEVQRINHKIREENGAEAIGKKIGLTSKKVQQQLGVDQPDFGVLFDDMKLENRAVLPWPETMQPKVEAEIAFILKKDLIQEKPSLLEIEDAIDYAVASIEIVGSRIENWQINILDTIADNASASHFVLGDDKKQISHFDLINCKMEMKVNGEIQSTGEGNACLGSPVIATQWLAEQMVSVENPLRTGDIILTGALGPMVQVQKGDLVEATIEGLGKVQIQFSRD